MNLSPEERIDALWSKIKIRAEFRRRQSQTGFAFVTLDDLKPYWDDASKIAHGLAVVIRGEQLNIFDKEKS